MTARRIVTNRVLAVGAVGLLLGTGLGRDVTAADDGGAGARTESLFSSTSAVPPGEWRNGPRGLYFMQWYDVVSRSLERHVYFFQNDRYVEDPESDGRGIDLRAKTPRKAGRWTLSGQQMTLAPDEGRPRTASAKPDASGCFEWDDTTWCPARAFATATLDGAYSGGSSYSSSFGSAATASDYVFSPDGTYRVLSAGSFTSPDRGPNGGVTASGRAQGRYRIEGLSLVLSGDGPEQRSLAFPFGENIDGPRPSQIFFGGRMLSRKDR